MEKRPMTRIEAIRSARKEAHRSRLEAAWNEIRRECDTRNLSAQLFGSFARGGIHDRSDLDIFVKTGTSRAAHWEISRSLDRIAQRHGVTLDLHFQDEEPDFFRQLNETEMSFAMRRDPVFLRIDAKRKRIDGELAIGQDAVRCHHATSSGSLRRHLLRSAGLTVHNICNGIEAIFESIAQDIDGSKPDASRNQRDLLLQLAQATERRGSMISADNLNAIADILGFRLAFRHAHAEPLRTASVMEMFKTLNDQIVPDVYKRIDDLEARLAEPALFPEHRRCGDGPDLRP